MCIEKSWWKYFWIGLFITFSVDWLPFLQSKVLQGRRDNAYVYWERFMRKHRKIVYRDEEINKNIIDFDFLREQKFNDFILKISLNRWCVAQKYMYTHKILGRLWYCNLKVKINTVLIWIYKIFVCFFLVFRWLKRQYTDTQPIRILFLSPEWIFTAKK